MSIPWALRSRRCPSLAGSGPRRGPRHQARPNACNPPGQLAAPASAQCHRSPWQRHPARSVGPGSAAPASLQTRWRSSAPSPMGRHACRNARADELVGCRKSRLGCRNSGIQPTSHSRAAAEPIRSKAASASCQPSRGHAACSAHVRPPRAVPDCPGFRERPELELAEESTREPGLDPGVAPLLAQPEHTVTPCPANPWCGCRAGCSPYPQRLHFPLDCPDRLRNITAHPLVRPEGRRSPSRSTL